MKKNILFYILVILSLFLASCYIETGYDISNKVKKIFTDLDGIYVLDCFGIYINNEKQSIDLFQKRGSCEFTTFHFYLQKKYRPKETNINVIIKNPIYKLKNNKDFLSFKEIAMYSLGAYYIIEDSNLERHFISTEERKLGLIGGYRYNLEFQEPVKARLLEYIEFDLSITDEEGEIHDYHLHYDITIKPVFKIGSTIWDYLDGH